jgi:N-acetylmuramoyl-L-alanine amidase
MPGILTELSCLSNEEQAKSLADPDHRQNIARGLFVGIRAYADARNRLGSRGSL